MWGMHDFTSAGRAEWRTTSAARIEKSYGPADNVADGCGSRSS